MAYYVNNKKFLNYEEQVLQNKDKIKALETSIGKGLPFQFRVWKEGDELFDVTRESKFSRTFIALAGNPTDNGNYVTFLKPNDDILEDSMERGIIVEDMVFHVCYDKNWLEEGTLYIISGGSNIASEVINEPIRLSIGNGAKLLEIII